jgi:hypothetical protein
MSYYNQQQQPPPVNPGYGYPPNQGYQPQGQNPGWNMGGGAMPQGGAHYAEGGVPKSEIGFTGMYLKLEQKKG